MNKNQIAIMSERLNVEPQELHSIVINTIMPNSERKVTNEQFISFLAVANEYKLNPMIKEIYAFPSKGGGIQPIVSIDGWLKIINTHPEFNGMEFKDNVIDGKLFSITCRMFRKDREHPIEVTEYMDECKGISEPWKKWPARMLRHKSAIQTARYAFGFSGIVDPDEADRIQQSEIDMGQATVVEKAIQPSPQTKPVGNSEQVNKGQVRLLKAKLSNAGKTETDLCNVFEIGSIDNLLMNQVNDAIAWITE